MKANSCWFPATCIAVVCLHSASGILAAPPVPEKTAGATGGATVSAGAPAAEVTTPASLIPVTSQMIDLGDDPETRYSGAPKFDWSFFGGQTRLIAKYAAMMPASRHILGINYRFYMIETAEFGYPPVWFVKDALEDKPAVPTIVFASIRKINYEEENSEHARAYDVKTIMPFVEKYPHTIFGGGQVAEVDAMFNWQYKQYYGRLPAGAGGAVFPAAYFDFLESNLKRSSVPYMLQQHNRGWGTHYVARERIMSLGSAQLFYRHNQVIVPSLTTLRSAARQYPFPYGVQFSGQINLTISNEDAVLRNKAKPVYAHVAGRLGDNYEKSYALCRQVLYLSWLNGARFFNWETGELIRARKELIPSPLGTFTARAAKLIESFGPTGPVQTPIALVSEFSNAWRPPVTEMSKRIEFTIVGDTPYASGDYQMHGIRDFFFPGYLQSEMIYGNTMGEDYALCPTPYGNSVDFLLSDARQEALSRYGLIIWTGVPPLAPSMVRDKLMRHMKENGGRAVLFGAAARNMFPEWFAKDKAERIAPGAKVAYRGETLTETADFMLEKLSDDPGAKPPSMKVLATVDGKPLIIECMGGLVLVLSDYGINSTASVNPSKATWSPGQLITQIPHTVLNHARRLLDDEARRQTLFSAGNNSLHYVVTRPGEGQYVLGIFNDKMTSEPFKITSNIGPITSIVETDLKDNKAELKSVVGGAAYAPPGLRSSPGLPLNYGLSDASHIEGRDFRLFRITVKERGVRAIPAIKYPSRPAGRVMAVAGLEDIRSYLQGISMFFTWFDGVKVDAGSFLSLDDSWLVEQAHWLDRRGVRVVVDGTGINEAKAAIVLNKLYLLKKAPRDLIVSSPSSTLRSSAQRMGVRLIDPGTVNRITKSGDGFKDGAALNIVDRYYSTEEDLSLDLARVAAGGNTGELRGESNPTSLYPAPKVDGGTSNDFFYAGPYISDLTDLLVRYRKDFSKFAGIKIDSTYLLSRNPAALERDRAALTNAGLRVVVDLRRDQMHFDRITFYPHIPNYKTGMALYSQIIDKMKAIGAVDLIVQIYDSGEMRNKDKYIEQRDKTWSEFARLAGQKGIKLHLVCSGGTKFSQAAAFNSPNVFVITGAKGTSSPYRLILPAGSTGNGTTKIYDANWGL
ncbi:MAG: hypothetical protein WCN98_04630 [Verrucomicrobiaceae bacterium]